MPGSITPLPILQEQQDNQATDDIQSPKSLVVRYGFLRLMAELPYDGQAVPLCSDKVVIRTERGVEMASVVSSSCPDFTHLVAVTRKQVMEYIENSGGKDYPYTTKGKVLRIASPDDFNEKVRIDARKPQLIEMVLRFINQLELTMNLVDVEQLLGGERVIFYYTAEDWVDFRELVKKLAAELQTRIEMMQVNAREEARLVADYEKCGQHCCCRQFLKVLRPVSMRSAKVQKATLDPQKISGRCSRLLCCLRYEDQTYSELKKKLPGKKILVETDNGIGLVISTQILSQLVMVKIGSAMPVVYPLEEIRILSDEEAAQYRAQQAASESTGTEIAYTPGTTESPEDEAQQDEEQLAKRKRKRRKRKRTQEAEDQPDRQGDTDTDEQPDTSQRDYEDRQQVSDEPLAPQQQQSEQNQQQGDSRKRRRRKRKRRRKRPGGSDQTGSGNTGGG